MKVFIFILTLAGLLFSCKSKEKAASFAQGNKETEKLLQADALIIEAVNQKNKGNLEKALELYQSCLKKPGNNAAIHYEIAQLVYELDKNYEEALKHIQVAIEDDPNNKWYLFFFLKINEENGQPKLVEDGFFMLVKAFPDHTDYVVEFADFYISQKEYEKAIVLYDQVEEKLGVTEAINKNKFLIYKGLKKDDLAINELKKLTTTFPINEKYYMELVDMYRLKKDKKMVQQTYELALQKMPNNSAVMDEYAHNCFLNNKIDTAFYLQKKVINDENYNIGYKLEIISLYLKYEKFDSTLATKRLSLQKNLEEIHPDDFQVNKFFGELYYREKKYGKARNKFEKAISLSPNSYGTWQQLIICDSELENFELMSKDALAGLEYFPTQSELYYFYGIAQVQLKEHKKAIDYFEQGLILSTNDRERMRFYSILGDSYHSLKNNNEAFKNYELALGIDSLNSLVLNNYAYYLSVLNQDLDKAEEMSNLSNILSPGTASFNDTYGWILYQMGKYDVALVWLLKAEENGGSESDVIMDHIGDSYFKLKQFNKALNYWKKAIELGGEKEVIQLKIDQI